ncbi:MAG: aldehyde ferredoxin oxidoreductase N-terminal domain-containing protein [Sphaerochaeta sp.]|uniref:aldehyde ferredoxin oxidoreductase N-terminal domain-containing protein n=1 Tax=Sphaerochaeta sp. TaxID=1972642 RepID=UPI003D0C5C79
MKQKHTLAFPYRQRSILHIDVDTETFEVLALEEAESKAYLGGRLLALFLWNRFARYDQLDEKHYESGNPVVFAPGAASDTPMPCCTVCSIVTKSPVTGRLSVTCASTPFAQGLLGCGYSALVITGRSRRLTSFSVAEGAVVFSNAEAFHDLSTTEVMHRMQAPHLVVAGPAGEHLVSHASIVVDNQNLTRGGVGKVFGLKNLKYFTLFPQATGRDSYDSERMGLLSQAYQKDMHTAKLGRTIAQEGSIALLSLANKHGWAAIDNYSMRMDGRLWGLCPRTAPDAEPPEDSVCPPCMQRSTLDLESAMALGSNLELFDGRSVQQLVVRCLENGLEPASAGSILSWARHCRMDGKLSFLPDMQRSSAMLYLRLLDSMAYQRGTGEQLSKPFVQLLATYGGEEHAFHVDGLALAPYDYRALPVQALLTSLGDDTLVYAELLWGNHYQRGNERRLAGWALYVQKVSYAAQSLGLCTWLLLPSFAHPVLHFPWFKRRKRTFARLALLASLSEGYELTAQDMQAYGAKALDLERTINGKLTGVQGRYGSLPDQLLVDGRSNYRSSQVVPLARLLDAYWSLLRVK